MNNRLKQFLLAENITQAQFADKLNVVRASVSHIIAGRNNPSYDFIKALMSHYPRLNMEWLIFGKGRMYVDALEHPATAASEPVSSRHIQEEPLLFDTQEEETEVPNTESINSNKVVQNTVSQRAVSKIIILYDDGTYQEM